jgi:hypothetical protein
MALVALLKLEPLWHYGIMALWHYGIVALVALLKLQPLSGPFQLAVQTTTCLLVAA